MKSSLSGKGLLPAFLSILVIASAARAETAPYPKLHIAFGIGANFTAAKVSEHYKLGWGEGLEIAYRFHRNLALIAGFHNSFNVYDTSELGTNVSDIYGTEFDCIGFYGGLKAIFPLRGRLTLFASGGAGKFEQETGDLIYNQRREGPGGGYVVELKSIYNVFRKDYFFGLTGAGGLEYELSRRFSLFLEMRVVYVVNTARTPPPEWAWLSPDVYENPPDAVFLPLRIGMSLRI